MKRFLQKNIVIIIIFLIILIIAILGSFALGYNKAKDDDNKNAEKAAVVDNCQELAGTEKQDCLKCIYEDPSKQTAKTGDIWTIIGCVDSSK